jgi:hypothetical protein
VARDPAARLPVVEGPVDCLEAGDQQSSKIVLADVERDSAAAARHNRKVRTRMTRRSKRNIGREELVPQIWTGR